MTDKRNRVLIVDMLNQFIRGWIVNPSKNDKGEPIGGIVASLKILQNLIGKTSPDRVVIIWDGEGGSKKRKILQKTYKEGRAPIRKNYEVPGMSEEEDRENRIWQMTRLMEYFNEMPVVQNIIDGVEADDVIAYTTQMPFFREWEKIIVSADQDMVQLINESTILYRPIQEEILTVESATEKYGVHPNNFAMAKAIAGDKGDNITGVPGVGFKSIANHLKLLKEEKDATFEDVFSFCRRENNNRQISKKKPLLVHENILKSKEIVESNYKLMQLYNPLLFVESKMILREIQEDFEFGLNKLSLMKMMAEDGVHIDNFSTMMRFFENLRNKEKSKKCPS